MLDPFGTLDYAATSTGTSLSFYQNSTLIQSLNVSARGSRLTIDCFGGGGYTYTWFNGVLYYLFLWQGRVLNLTELTSFAANPWQLFGTDTPSSEASHGIMLAHM